MKKNVIGIVGGMGPQADIFLLKNIHAIASADKDQDHLSTILMSFPSDIVDRSTYLDKLDSINPGIRIAEIICQLKKSGADIVGIACNTSYAPKIYNEILYRLEICKCEVKLLHMPNETCIYIQENFKDVKKIGCITTNGTYNSRLYLDILQSNGYDVIIPDLDFQQEVIHNMIYNTGYGLKATAGIVSEEVKLLAFKIVDFFKNHNVDLILLGCTDLSVLHTEKLITGIHIVDSTEILAKALIREANSE